MACADLFVAGLDDGVPVLDGGDGVRVADSQDGLPQAGGLVQSRPLLLQLLHEVLRTTP